MTLRGFRRLPERRAGPVPWMDAATEGDLRHPRGIRAGRGLERRRTTTGHCGRGLLAMQPFPNATDDPVAVSFCNGNGRLSGPSAVPVVLEPRHAVSLGLEWSDAGGLPLRHPAGQPAGPPDQARPAAHPHRAFRSRGNCVPVNSLLTNRKTSIRPLELAM